MPMWLMPIWCISHRLYFLEWSRSDVTAIFGTMSITHVQIVATQRDGDQERTLS
jgi:hypothetical protein